MNWSACRLTLPDPALIQCDSVYKTHLAVGHHSFLNDTPLFKTRVEDGGWKVEDGVVVGHLSGDCYDPSSILRPR